MTKKITIRLLDKAYDIKCPEKEAENLKLAALQINTHMLKNKRQFKNLSDFQALLLAALHVSHELIQTQSQHDERQSQLTQFISSLENKINQATNDTVPAESE